MTIGSGLDRLPEADARTRRAFDRMRSLLADACLLKSSSTTQAGNTAATETTFFTYTIAERALSTNDVLSFEAGGTFAATAATDKRIRVKLGSTTIYDSGNLSITTAESWVLRGSVFRSGSASQKCVVTLATSSAALTSDASYTSTSESMASAVTLTVTGQGTNASDVVGECFKVIHQPS